MGHSARVKSLDTLLEWKASLCTFTAEAKEALASVEMEIQRLLAWLEEQAKYWRGLERKCEDEVFQAKNELARRKIMKIGDRTPDTTEQEKAVRKATAKLAFVQEQIENTRHWLRELPDAVIDYEGPAKQLAGMLEADLPRMGAVLERQIAALEGYVQIASTVAPAAAITDASLTEPAGHDSAPDTQKTVSPGGKAP
jgi:uncharacterized protein YaeQ